MKTAKHNVVMRHEYDFTSGVRGKYRHNLFNSQQQERQGLKLDGPYYKTLLDEASAAGQPYDEKSVDCIRSSVSNLLDVQTSTDRPGMLLGKIQSGKTKTFLGIIALALDNGFDSVIVFTKGTRALTTQTFERLSETFLTAIDDDILRVFDIMQMPRLTLYEQKHPIIIVAKKEKRNLEKLKKTIVEDYPDLASRRVLIIDDEADFASVGFKRNRTELAELQTIMRQISDLRQVLTNSAFLQVTATPYSLYLQPTSQVSSSQPEFMPVRPAFTDLVPVHNRYIGGKFYFEDSQTPGTVASYLYSPVDNNELSLLHHSDRRRFKLEEVLTSKAIVQLRHAIVTFIVGGIIRRIQSSHANERPSKYSFIIHTETSRDAHAWQEKLVDALIVELRNASEANMDVFKSLVQASYDDLSRSVADGEQYLPSFEELIRKVKDYLPAIQVEKVNSEADVQLLLDRNGQLNLRNKLNIFIGGQILDRGLTIGNLIGFYYGRRTQRFQQDTVLQHSRMYGARPPADLTVTRFYTSEEIYGVLRTIHDFDSALRDTFENGGHDKGVIFVRQQNNRIVPCSPNKILISTLTTLSSGKRLLPVGFQTHYKSQTEVTVKKIDSLLKRLNPGSEAPFLISLDDALLIVDEINSTFEYSEDEKAYKWNVDAFKSSLRYVSRSSNNVAERDKVYILVRAGRDNVRRREDDNRFFNAPDTAHVEGRIAKKTAIDAPMLMLFRQNGNKSKGWRDTPFWWPVLYMPQNLNTVVFASDVNDADDDAALAESMV